VVAAERMQSYEGREGECAEVAHGGSCCGDCSRSSSRMLCCCCCCCCCCMIRMLVVASQHAVIHAPAAQSLPDQHQEANDAVDGDQGESKEATGHHGCCDVQRRIDLPTQAEGRFLVQVRAAATSCLSGASTRQDRCIFVLLPLKQCD
jgi:hypothetical protein